MSPSRRWRHRRARAGRYITLAAVTLVAVRWAWTTHPALTILTGLTVAWAAAAWWRARRPADPADPELDQRPTVLYRHYFTTGAPLYYGITNHYSARMAQHAATSWWYAYVDWSKSTVQTFPHRRAALAAETAAIRADTPIGNQDENPLYWQQEPHRAQLQAAIGWTPPAPPRAARDIPRRRLPGWRWAS